MVNGKYFITDSPSVSTEGLFYFWYIEEPKPTKMDLEPTCEIIFQLHKSQKGVRWAKEILREYQLASTARTKLLQEKIILNPAYGDRTQLNPDVHDCGSYEQALSLLKHKNKYTLSVFAFFKQNGFDGEYFWSTISSACNILSEDSEDTKNILCYQEYIYKSISTQDGDLVKANPQNITAALHGILIPENKKSSSIDLSGNKGIINYQNQDSDSINSISKTPPKQTNATIAKTIKWFFLIVGAIAAVLTATKLAWDWPK
jgi:hypothetical protein